MTPFAFDTLSASKQLREAGMPEGVAEAVVSVFQHASAMPDISHLATRADLDAQGALMKVDLDAQGALMKADLDAHRASMKADLDAQGLSLRADLDAQGVSIRADLDLMKADIGALKRDMATKTDIADLRADFSAKLYQQTLFTIGGISALVTALNVTLKMLG